MLSTIKNTCQLSYSYRAHLFQTFYYLKTSLKFETIYYHQITRLEFVLLFLLWFCFLKKNILYFPKKTKSLEYKLSYVMQNRVSILQYQLKQINLKILYLCIF